VERFDLVDHAHRDAGAAADGGEGELLDDLLGLVPLRTLIHRHRDGSV
jgi:hypothetical protein